MTLSYSVDHDPVLTADQGRWLGIREDHHGLSHNGGYAAKSAKLAAIDPWKVEQYAYSSRS